MRLLWLAILMGMVGLAPAVEARPDRCDSACQKSSKKKKSKKKKKTAYEKEIEAEEGAEEEPEPSPSPSPPPSPSPSPEPAKKAPTVVAPPPPTPIPTTSGPRRGSTLIAGSLSRWSNAGAMEPIASEVELTAPLPARAVPLLPGQDTPGQRLIDDGDRLSAHLAIFADHLETVRQDAHDVDLVRARATLDYTRIGGSDFGLHLDLEYRAAASTSRLSDRRINALFASYGALDFRRDDGPSWGIALGRVLVREAGYQQVDGGALRVRVMPELKLGAYGGVTGNPYVYNWRLARTEDFSADWIAAGLFGSVRTGALFADFAVGMSMVTAAGGGLDRLFFIADAGYALREDLDLFLTTWIDFIKIGTAFQSVELLMSWKISDAMHLSASASRYGSLVYAFSTNYSFRFDPAGSAVGANQTAVDANGAPILAYDALALQSIYDEVAARFGVRILDGLEPYAALTLQVRESGEAGAEELAALRLMPSLGVSLRHPKFADLVVQITGIVDAQTERKAIFTAAIGRDFDGLRPAIDLRAHFGGVGALEGGLELAYTIPRELVPGRLLLRTQLRYTREDVAIARPPERCLGATPDPTCAILGPDVVLPFVPLQESFYGFAGVDWRY